ncbi:MAG: phosphoethanolamine transferase [Chitinophagaceae bacterium]
MKSRQLKQRQIYVLIIGESARYDHWEINGYDRSTSPHLMTEKDFLDFRHAAAGGVITELSVPQMLTGVTAETYNQHLRRGGLLTLFKQAGYKTYWLTNQTDKGDIRLHSRFADTRILMQNTDGSSEHLHYDLELVTKMKELLMQDSSNSFVIIHCIGSHYNYTSRYPSSFNYFKPVYTNELATPTDESKKNELINAYDNTILYTDAVIDSVIKVVNGLHCVTSVLYASDHGENLFDDSRHLILHAPAPPNIYIAHIPFFIYCSEDYISDYPKKWYWLNMNIDNKVSNNQIFATLSDMAGIHFRGEDLHNSIADSSFINSNQEILGPNSKVYYYSNLNPEK